MSRKDVRLLRTAVLIRVLQEKSGQSRGNLLYQYNAQREGYAIDWSDAVSHRYVGLLFPLFLPLHYLLFFLFFSLLLSFLVLLQTFLFVSLSAC